MASSKMKEVEKAAAPFFHDVRDFVFGRPATMENMVCPYSPTEALVIYISFFIVQCKPWKNLDPILY